MEPVRFAKPFDSPEWGYQIKWEVRLHPPYLVVLAEFLEWTDDLKVRHPKVLGFSATNPQECRLVQSNGGRENGTPS